jgi:hypothetical protein
MTRTDNMTYYFFFISLSFYFRFFAFLLFLLHSKTIFRATTPTQANKQIPWLESAIELKRLKDRRFPAKLLPTFADRGTTWSEQRIPTTVFSAF